MRDKVVAVLLIFFLIAIIIAFISFIENGSGQSSVGNAFPTITAVPTINPNSLKPIDFSGFTSNVQLNDVSFLIGKTVSLPLTESVYYANPVDQTYLTQTMLLTTDPDTGLLTNGTYYVESSSTGISLTLRQSAIAGRETIAQMENKFLAFYQNTLQLDPTQLSISYVSTSGSRAYFDATQTINNQKVFYLGNSVPMNITMSTSGQVMYVSINNIFRNPKLVGPYPVAYTMRVDYSAYLLGVYSSSLTAENPPTPIHNTGGITSSYNPGYYYDSATGNIIPVENFIGSVQDETGKTYPLSILTSLLSPNDINSIVAPTPTSIADNGVG